MATSGPRRCTLGKFVFAVKEGKVNIFNKRRGEQRKHFFTFKDSQVRKLRDWLNWYLDNK